MRNFTNSPRVMLMIGMLLLASSCDAANPGPNQATNPKPLNPLGYYMLDESVLLKCYYTIEDDAINSHPILGMNVSISTPPKNIDDLVSQLKTALPEVTVTKDPDNSQVIHIARTALVSQPQYILNQKLTLSYSGTARGLITTIGSNTNGQVTPQTAFIGDVIHSDGTTPVKVTSDNQPIRQLLTNAVPLDHYSFLIWEAAANTVNGKEIVQVNFTDQISRSQDTIMAVPGLERHSECNERFSAVKMMILFRRQHVQLKPPNPCSLLP